MIHSEGMWSNDLANIVKLELLLVWCGNSQFEKVGMASEWFSSRICEQQKQWCEEMHAVMMNLLTLYDQLPEMSTEMSKTVLSKCSDEQALYTARQSSIRRPKME